MFLVPFACLLRQGNECHLEVQSAGPQKKNGGLSSLVAPLKSICLGLVRCLIKVLQTTPICDVSVNTRNTKKSTAVVVSLPRFVLLQFDHDSQGTSLQTRLSVTKETGLIVVQQCFGSALPVA